VFARFGSRCLTDEDFYACLTQSQGARPHADLERHLKRCSDCQDRLSGLKELLEPELPEIREAFPESTAEEIQETLSLIARQGKREATK